ncbi:MAG TPA: S9 family peptidase, partial [Ferruginibacter sp.]|nr:S9 family peptidase [Ferruginibacter sp.]
MKQILIIASALLSLSSIAQNKMTPELLWKLGRVSGLGVSTDGKYVLYSVSTPNAAENKSSRRTFAIPVNGGNPIPVSNADSMLPNGKISPDGKYMISSAEVKVKKVTGKEFYPELQKSNVYIFDNLNYRHWDTYEDGNFDHVMLTPLLNGVAGNPVDLMPGEPYDCPQKPFGGDEDYVWNPNGKEVVYCTKKKYGTAYAVSTNTDLYAYNIETGKTRNLTEGMMGYDINPSFNSKGEMAWLSMRRDGYEADKQDIFVSNGITKMNLTGSRDDIHVEGYRWSDDGRKLFFYAPINGTMQLFEVNYPGLTKMMPVVRQITQGDFDVSGIVGQSG